jgi:Alpha/beta hydrolase domain
MPFALVACIVLCLPVSAGTEVSSLEVESRQDVLGGKPFGPVGPYEKLAGRIFFTFAPANPMNARIADIENAPRDAEGRAGAWGNFMVLRPKQQAKGRRVALLEVSNRGGKASLAYFNGARYSLDPTSPEHFGDELLIRQGLTLIWVGWQFDVPPQPGLLRLHVPVATDAGKAIQGVIRSDWTVDQTTTTLPLSHRGHVAYPVSDPQHPDNVLTERDGRLAPRRIISRERWRFTREVEGQGTADQPHIYMPGGFQAGKIYELVYRATHPAVVGLGLAVVRDMMSYAKYDERCPFSVDKGIAFGVSQTGRFLRHFLYQGFNTDELSRRVFDGMLIHSAGAGRGSFNHRFAQPSRDAHRYSAFFYPTDLFPFTSRTQWDSETGKSDGLFAHQHHPHHLPKVLSTNTGYEYWGRAASLIHTSVDGRADVEPLPNERVYHLASGQHFVGRFPPGPMEGLPNADAYRGNPVDFLVNLRALLVRLVDWVTIDREPPVSAYPRIAAGTLVPIDQVRFPKIPGVPFPQVIHEAYRADYGPRWREGIIAYEPPRLGSAFSTRVAQVDGLGNEVGGVRNVELQVPLATYAPWHLRAGYAGGASELMDFFGTYMPLPRTEVERLHRSDPRPSVEALYATREDYLQRAKEAAAGLVEQGYVMPEDVARVLKRAEEHWEWFMAR